MKPAAPPHEDTPAAGALPADRANAELRAADTVRARTAQLFRHTLKSGGINPLLYLVARFRQGHRGEGDRP